MNVQEWLIKKLLEGKLKNIREFLDGYKTYISAGLIGLFAALQYLGYEIPVWVYGVLGALGLGSLRAAVSKK